jgi:hypothetical protein
LPPIFTGGNCKPEHGRFCAATLDRAAERK